MVAHAEYLRSPQAEIDDNARLVEGFKYLEPTLIENWPQALRNMSFPSRSIILSRVDILALGSNMFELAEYFIERYGVSYRMPISGIVQKIDVLTKDWADGFVVKLGGRTPKDTMAWYKSNGRARNSKEAMRFLLDCSERMMEDCLLFLAVDKAPRIWLREWMYIPPWAEFRCMLFNKQLKAISQYEYQKFFPELLKYRKSIEDAIVEFSQGFATASHIDDVVFDVYCFLVGDKWHVRLIELNPATTLTDPCLLSYSDIKEWRPSLLIVEKPPAAI